MARLALFAVLLGNPNVPALIDQLGDDDIEVRERATQELIRAGDLALSDLERACDDPDPEVSARARRILAAIGPMQIVVGIGASGSKENLVPVTWVLKNLLSEEEVYYVPGFRRRIVLLELFEEPDRSRRAGWGAKYMLRKCLLDESDFLTVWIGEQHESRIDDLRGCAMDIDPPLLAGFPELDMVAVGLAGRYRLEYSYRFDRAAYKGRCAKNCPSHDDAAMPWNRAVTRPLDASAEFTLR